MPQDQTNQADTGRLEAVVLPRSLEAMTREERSLLLYMETCAVDRSGRVESCWMNGDDRKILDRWNADGFVQFGRVAASYLQGQPAGSHWCRLSDEAWRLAHEERRARADRTWATRRWETTAEKNAT